MIADLWKAKVIKIKQINSNTVAQSHRKINSNKSPTPILHQPIDKDNVSSSSNSLNTEPCNKQIVHYYPNVTYSRIYINIHTNSSLLFMRDRLGKLLGSPGAQPDLVLQDYLIIFPIIYGKCYCSSLFYLLYSNLLTLT
jgi:hypothetical protein